MRSIFLSVSVFLVTACASFNEAPSVKELGGPDLATVIIALDWQETSFDFDLGKDITINSNDLLDAKAGAISSQKKAIKYRDSETLSKPLYYIYNQRYLFRSSVKDFIIKKFHLKKASYQRVTMHQVPAGTLKLESLRQFVKMLDEKSTDLAWHYYPSEQSILLPAKTWALKAGGIYYLGSLTLHFKTDKVIYGILPREPVNKSIELEKAVWRNNFKEDLAILNKKNYDLAPEKVIDLAEF